ncbi:MAG: serine hydrolase domain-containing protein [Promethearchaeota archaeon]
MRRKVVEMIENLIINIMKQMQIPGLTIAIIQDGELVYSGGFGARNLEINLPMTENTLFGIGSITKSFTALAIMQLVEQGKIELNSPLNKYIDFKLGSKRNPITIHHALSHSSGIPDLNGAVLAIAKGSGFMDPLYPMSSRKDFLLHLNGAFKEILYEPDKNFLYNNDLFTSLGLIIESITGMEYDVYIKENILKPLGMNKSFFSRDEFEREDNKATGYVSIKKDEPLKGIEHLCDFLLYAPGGLITTVTQMVNYMKGLMNGGVFEGNQIIKKSSLEQMWSHHIEIPENNRYSVATKGWYGYGWITEDFFDHVLIHHGGSIPGISAICAMIPEKKLGIVVGINRDLGEMRKILISTLIALLLGINVNDANPILNIQKLVKKLIGNYRLYNNFMACAVYIKDGILYVRAKFPIPGYPQINAPIVAQNLDELKFYIPVIFPGFKLNVQFFIDENSGIVHLVIDRYYFHKIE